MLCKQCVWGNIRRGLMMYFRVRSRINVKMFLTNCQKLMDVKRRIMYYHMEIFKKADVIVTPTTGMTAPIIPPSALKYGETDMRVTGYLMSFILAANLLGLPAITVPVGYDKQGLPIGLQIIGRPWGEASILRLASAVEELCAMKKQPVLFYDVLKSK
ncbi:fatty acid amide hydrolase-like isoform X2 [Carica papaya]|uniref:fatty acid amide hydrolase-like isoform X2 n=1 Tax=Carica papaya TaxID=3649 RepID=UPI000B8CEFC1|nr:fatty acid amide hydrolase-like isoform X2 [Carica papaya]